MNNYKALNFNIDSLLLQSNHYYGLNIQAISPRVDSAISYAYDDNFNQVEKVVVNKVLEPSFHFSVHGDSVANIYNYWNRNGQLERTGTGDLFLPMPFVKSYCKKKYGKELTIESGGFHSEGSSNSINCILFFRLLFTRIPPELLRYLPAGPGKSIANLESIEINLRKSGTKIKLQGKINKKKNDLPMMEL